MTNRRSTKVIAIENLFKKDKSGSTTVISDWFGKNKEILGSLNRSQVLLTPVSRKLSASTYTSNKKPSTLIDDIIGVKKINSTRKLDFDASPKTTTEESIRFPHIDAIFKIKNYFEHVSEDEVIRLDKRSVSGLIEMKVLINKKLATSPFFYN